MRNTREFEHRELAGLLLRALCRRSPSELEPRVGQTKLAKDIWIPGCRNWTGAMNGKEPSAV